MPFVTISLLDADSSLVCGTISKDDGSFTIESSNGSSLLRASYMGYTTAYREVSTSPIRIILNEETTQLNEVTIQGKEKILARHMDKIVMNIASSPFAIGNNGKDILKKAPGVNIDRKGKVTVNGKAVEIYIDGRPTYLSGEQLKTMLEGTNGSTIDRLEIITQPSAKYDAAGQGGIINIRTKKNKSRGVNGSLSAGYGGMYWRDIREYVQEDHASLNLNYRGAKTYTMLSLTQQYSDRTESSTSTLSTLEEARETESRTRAKNQYYMLKLSNDWHIDSVNTLGLMYSTPLSFSSNRALPEYNRSTLMQAGVLKEQNTDDISSSDRWMQHSAKLHYSHTFPGDKEQELTLNFDYNRNRSNLLNRTLCSYSLPTIYEQEVEHTNLHITNIYSGRLDFESQFWETGKIECGAKWSSTETDYDSRTDSSSTMGEDREPLLSIFVYREHVGALYATMSKQFGEHWSAKLGLRGENTLSAGEWKTADSTTTRSYFNLFPTVFVGYMPTEDWSLSVDYSRRIQRPNYRMLDPSSEPEDGHSIRTGNPNLKPAFTHNVLMSAGYSEYVSIDFDLAHTTDWIDYQTRILPGGERVSQATNYGSNTSHGIRLSLTEIPLVPKLSGRNADGKREVTGAWLALTAHAGAMREHYRSYDKQLDMKHWSMDIYAELNAYLPKDWTLSADGFYSTPSVWGAERLSAWKELNLAVKKDFPKHGVSITARVNDLTLSSKWKSESLGLSEGYSNTFSGADRAHMFTVGVSWKFGSSMERPSYSDSSMDNDRGSPQRGRRGRK